MKAVITGITGFAGTHLARHLLDQGDRVLGVARHLPSPGSELSQRGVAFVRCDLAEELDGAAGQELRARVADFAPDCVFHLAALAVPGECGEEQPTAEAWKINVTATRRWGQLVAELPGAPVMVFTSSCQVYAAVTPARPVVDEQAPVGPRRGYGRSKLAAEQELLELHQQTGLRVVIARAFNHTGPGQARRMLLPDWASQFADPARDCITVISLEAYVDLGDVRDTVRAYRLLARHGSPGKIYNVGTGFATRSGDLFGMLEAICGPRRVHETRPGRQQGPVACSAALHRATGWQPTLGLRQTVADTLRFWQP